MTIRSSVTIISHLSLSLYMSLSPSLQLSLSSSPCQSICLSHSHIFGCLTPHTPFASLVSRTLATRTVMSSMRSWILQLWPPLPAHEALLTLALGTLSSMQPSSLAHTSACHYRPFPSDFGLKVHILMHCFPSFIPPFTCTDLPLYTPHGSPVYLPLYSWPSFDFPLAALQKVWGRDIFRLLILHNIALMEKMSSARDHSFGHKGSISFRRCDARYESLANKTLFSYITSSFHLSVFICMNPNPREICRDNFSHVKI